jgi:hypothetical protein
LAWSAASFLDLTLLLRENEKRSKTDSDPSHYAEKT